jgi:bifunctional enzyme CysN/CysC/sulfate adenylyltransferase subunit 1
MDAALATRETVPENLQTFLDQHLERGLLRFSTAGSVDDGKSTLIGRLLHDTQSVYDDQLASIKKSRINRSTGAIDFSLLTDGLRAEREQGITIDVAYRYFSTAKRKFIIADTPGHEQYTRNMATGASTADLAIVLLDAAAFAKHGGLLPQSRRHTFIASLLRIPHVVAAVNKMDLVGYDATAFAAIEAEYVALAKHLGISSLQVIPISALEGDNVVTRSRHMTWYSGPTLLEQLERVSLSRHDGNAPLRFPVQLVLRPDANFRGYAGQVAGGTLSAGQTVMALPSRRLTWVRNIVTWNGNLASAAAPQSVTVELEDEIDLSRGDLLASPQNPPLVSHGFAAQVVWMHEEPLKVGQTYLAKHTTRTVRATVTAIRHRVDVNTLEHLPAQQIDMNDIAEVEFHTARPLFFDVYSSNRATGSLILIDPLSNATVGAAMISEALEEANAIAKLPALIHLTGRAELAKQIHNALREEGHNAVLLDDAHIAPEEIATAIRGAQLAGACAITSAVIPKNTATAITKFIDAAQVLRPEKLDADDAVAANSLLQQMGVA